MNGRADVSSALRRYSAAIVPRFATLLVLAATPLFAGTLTHVNHSTAADSHITLRREGQRLHLVESRTRSIVAQAPVATTDRVEIRGASGKHDDTLTIDLTEPIVLAGGIDYDGGSAGWDTLVLQGGSTREQRITQLTPHDGVIDIDGLVIRYSNLEPITDTAPAASLTINGTAGTDNVTIGNGPGGTTTVSSPTFESVTFANKTNVVFDGLGGGDFVVFNNPNPATGLSSFIVTNVGQVSQTGDLRYPRFGVNATGLVTLQNLTNDVDRVEITTQNGHIVFIDADDLIVGGVSSTLAGVRAVQSGGVSAQTMAGNLTLDDTDAAEIVKAGDLSGDVVLNAGGSGSDLTVAVDRDAAIAPAGSVWIQALGDLLLGTGGPAFANDIRAATSVTLTVGTLVLGGLTTVTSDAFGQNSGGDLLVFGATQQTGGARFLAAGTAGANVEIVTGIGTIQFLGTVIAAESVSGDVTLHARGLTIVPASGATAAQRVEIRANGIDLGATIEVPGSPMELSDAELDRLFAPTVEIHATLESLIRVMGLITFTTGTELLLRTDAYVTGGGRLSAQVLTYEIPNFSVSPYIWTITPASIRVYAGTAVPYSGVTTLNARARLTSPDFLYPPNVEETFFVSPSPTTRINIDGHLPTPPATPGDVLDFDLSGVTNPVLIATFTATGYQGSLTSSNRQPVNFQDIEQLVDAPVDLAISKTDNANTAVAGTSMTYTIVVSNSAPIPVTGATVTDNFPSQLSGIMWTCAPSAGSTCTLNGSGNISDTVTLAANGSVTYTINATINPGATNTITNLASVTTPAGYFDVNFSNNSAFDSTQPIAVADLIVTKTASSPTANRSETISYTITLRNAGPSDSHNVTLTDAVPAMTTFVSLSAPAGYSCTTPVSGGTGTVTCTRAVLPPSAAADMFTLVVRVDSGLAPGASITNTATASSTTADPGGNSSATAAVAVSGANVPALSPLMAGFLAMLLAIVACRLIRASA